MKKVMWGLLGLGVVICMAALRLYPSFEKARPAIDRLDNAEKALQELTKHPPQPTGKDDDSKPPVPVRKASYNSVGADGCIYLGPDGSRVALVRDERQLDANLDWKGESYARVYDLKTGNALSACLKHDESIADCTFSPDGKRLLTLPSLLDGKKMARVWDLETGKQVLTFKHREDVVAGHFSPDGLKIVIAAVGDKTADGHQQVSYVWNARTGDLIKRIQHDALYTQAAFSPDGEYVLTIGRKAAQVWASRTGDPVGLLLKPSEGYWFSGAWMGKAQRFSRDSKQVVTIEENSFGQNKVQLHEVATGDPAGACINLEANPVSLTALGISSDGRHLATASQGGGVTIWDVQSGKALATCRHDGGGVLSVVFSPDGKRLAVTFSETVQIWDSATGKTIATQPFRFSHKWEGKTAASKWLMKTAFSPDGGQLILVDAAGYAGVWNAQTGKEITRVQVSPQ
ncbi:MAG TPA: WD40 repeat domain-containing protein [Gemmataceae bacterium]|nr:WD40 repeat domain-containing protein [Gemmataceae bacterium]